MINNLEEEDSTNGRELGASKHNPFVIYRDLYHRGWYFANEKCKERGGALASIHSDYENDKLGYLLYKSKLDRIWLGSSDLTYGGLTTFTWVDGTDVDYTNWITIPAQPDGDGKCMEMVQQYTVFNNRWNDTPCKGSKGNKSVKQGYACRFDKVVYPTPYPTRRPTPYPTKYYKPVRF